MGSEVIAPLIWGYNEGDTLLVKETLMVNEGDTVGEGDAHGQWTRHSVGEGATHGPSSGDNFEISPSFFCFPQLNSGCYVLRKTVNDSKVCNKARVWQY